MSGSAIGLGSDVGGSLRIPVGYCGGYSLKPGPGRFSVIGMACEFLLLFSVRSSGAYALCILAPVPGFEGLKTTAGPIARQVTSFSACVI